MVVNICGYKSSVKCAESLMDMFSWTFIVSLCLNCQILLPVLQLEHAGRDSFFICLLSVVYIFRFGDYQHPLF